MLRTTLLAIALAAWLEAGTLLVLLVRRVAGLRLGSVGSVAVRSAIASALAGVAAIAVRIVVGGAILPDPVVGGLTTIPALVATLVAVTAAFAAVFVGAALALRLTELRSIVEIMIDAIRRPRRS